MSMRNLNTSTLVGMISAAAIIGGVLLMADEPGMFLNLPGLLIVVGGTLAATVFSYPLSEVTKVFSSLRVLLRNEDLSAFKEAEEIVRAARLLASRKIPDAETLVENSNNPFLRTGIQLVLDRVPVSEISDLLQWRMLKVKQKENADAQIFHSMAAFAPAFGMVGTLLGLINMLNVMTSQGFDQVASSMGIALITTFYGIVLANLIFKPIAIKLEQRTEKRLMLMNMVLEGIILLGQRRTPAFIRETLKSFITHYEDEIMESPQGPELASGEERSTGSPPQANAAVNQ